MGQPVYIFLCTDDQAFTSVIPYYFEGTPVQVFPLSLLAGAMQLAVNCSHFVIGLPMLDDSDWRLLELIKGPDIPKYLLVRRAVTAQDNRRAKALGVSEILVDPIVKLRNGVGRNVDDLISALRQAADDDELAPTTVFLGSGTYFHTEQNLVTYENKRTQLSDREADVLKLFLRCEGKLLTKTTIAEELWSGRVAVNGIPKLIARLREKLGPAGHMVSGRKQGGYIYERFK